MKVENKKCGHSIINRIGLQKTIVIGIILFLIIIFSIGSPSFRKYTTLVTILDYSYYITLMAIGVTFILVSGGIDLSIGTGMICYSLVGGFFIVNLGFPVWVGFLVSIAMGIIIGSLNGFFVAICNIPPFISTLCFMMMTRGIGSIITGGKAITWPRGKGAAGAFRNIFKIKIGNSIIPLGFLWILLIVFCMEIVLKRTKIGRYIMAIGSNKEALRLSGVDVRKWHMLAYMICGLLTGLAGFAYAGTFTAVNAGSGAGLELDAIGAAIIGGTSTAGGVGSVTGTLLGVFIFSLLKTGLPFIGLQANWQQIITGIVLISVILVDVSRNAEKR